MSLSRRFIAAAFVVAAAAGCSNGGSGAVVAAASSGNPAPTTSASPPPAPFVPAVSPAKVTAACPFLDPAEIAKAFGDPNIYDSSEQIPSIQGGLTVYTCKYHRADDPGSLMGALEVADTPTMVAQKTMLQVAEQECADKAQPLGEGAIYCLSKGNGTDIAVIEPSHGVTRIAHLSLAVTRNDGLRAGYTTLAKTLADRL
ncbi:hypothetical protein QRX50_05570 [Amycolatopsis carbonis]|uniref:DUF3558 domain-containing protein n=1 Tax=Amycolatopsis carbonis TaxID=715471 RepID=A0A9Y2IHN2_9PSEU|nr:hypothetical protein [Amycolatopsis sp. 2-15]WIX80257.1 hypothetical protein QRX50_05570 [Amycolatopsis sp. 2-15]